MKLWLCFGTSLLALGGAAVAAPTIDPIFGDHAVVQRQQPVIVTGSAEAGAALTVSLNGREVKTKAGKDGRFAATLPPMEAGGPYTLSVQGTSGAAQSSDILIGDVFLCSGQSNMELPVQGAQDGWNQAQASADDQLRLTTIAKVTALTPQTSLSQAPIWVAASPKTVPSFSAACFYMTQELRKSSKVPVGAIHSSWGGSAISAWMGDAAQRAAGRSVQADLLKLYVRDPAAAARQSGAIWEDWWRKGTGDAPGHEPWQPSASLDWKPVPKITVWEEWGLPELASYNGMMWFRKAVTLTAAQAAQVAHLGVGAVDDVDETWVNGVPAGGGGNPGAPRDYILPVGTLHAGENVIVVNANDVFASGGLRGPVESMKISFADGSSVLIAEGWTYSIEKRLPKNPPRLPWDDIAGAGTMYNAMIAPLGRLHLKGVAWYQGESDTDIPGYADRLNAMIAAWRAQFGQPDLPFAIVQLANYGDPATKPVESNWAQLREQQRQVDARDPKAALALAIDLGDPLDIHPGEKHELGRRLARAMRSIAYGDPSAASGPQVASATRNSDGSVTVRFDGVTGSLHARSADAPIAFELCGEGSGSCRFASGRIAGSSVTLAGDGQPVTRVRYAWADSPSVNLYDEAPLPAGPFETPVH